MISSDIPDRNGSQSSNHGALISPRELSSIEIRNSSQHLPTKERKLMDLMNG